MATSRRLRSTVTVTDQFCGAGGSSIGAVAAGAELRLAMNHWRVAIETHAANFRDADHVCADIQTTDPRRFAPTDVLITSPECTNHSQAKNRTSFNPNKPSLFDEQAGAERSRATMWDVPRFAEAHDYRCIVVENVVEAAKWRLFPSWLHAMAALDYVAEPVFVNSMAAPPTPQSRDRMYVVFHKRQHPAPDLRFCPLAPCAHCGVDVGAEQSWKPKTASWPLERWGKYRAQYVYRCPRCAHVVEPYAMPAASAIDWQLPAQRIGDRDVPLREATLRRIRAGLERFGGAHLVQVGGNTFERRDGVRTWSVEGPAPTMTTDLVHGLAAPFMVELRGGGCKDAAYPIDEPLRTMCAGGNHHGVVVPVSRGHDPAKRATSTGAPFPTQTSRLEYGLAFPPSFIVKNYGGDPGPMVKSPAEPFGAVTAQDHHAVVGMPWLSTYYGNGGAHPVDRPGPTQGTRDTAALIDPREALDVDDCTFRMLEPHEVGAAMAFPSTYKVHGNKRQRVRQYGNAVTPPVMSMILERVLATFN